MTHTPLIFAVTKQFSLIKRFSFLVVALTPLLALPSDVLAEETKITVDAKALYERQCSTCHGQNAEGNQALKSPTIAGQSAWYIKNQLNAFKNDYRGGTPEDKLGAGMAAIAKTLNDKQINSLAAYLESLTPMKPTATLKGNIEAGEQFYNSVCGSCHGPNGKGNASLNSPKLAGLNDWYIVGQLTKYRSNLRGYHAKDRLGRQMKMMSGVIQDEQTLKNLAAYLSQQ